MFAAMTLAPPVVQAVPRRGARGHIIDVLIAERAPKLSASPAWPFVRPAIYALLDYAKARREADHIADMPGKAALDYVAALLSVRVSVKGLEHVPETGRLVVISNHPTGIADGVALYDALKGKRPDICFYANSDVHRIAPRFDEVLIPVEWVEAKRTRERTRITLQYTKEAMETERALAIFPSGRLARRTPGGGLSDPPWMASALSIARKYAVPIAPVHMAGPWSTLFHFFDRFSAELRDITLFHELLNKRGRRFEITIGPLIPPEALEGEATTRTDALKAYIERSLPADPDLPFA